MALKREIEVGIGSIPSVEFVPSGNKQPFVGAGNLVTWVCVATDPKSIQMFTKALIIPPIRAPFQLQNGTNAARTNTPSSGPRTAPKTDAAMATSEPLTNNITKDEARQQSPNNKVIDLLHNVFRASVQCMKYGSSMSFHMTADIEFMDDDSDDSDPLNKLENSKPGSPG